MGMALDYSSSKNVELSRDLLVLCAHNIHVLLCIVCIHVCVGTCTYRCINMCYCVLYVYV